MELLLCSTVVACLTSAWYLVPETDVAWQLRRDVLFLEALGLMNYCLFVGVHCRNPEDAAVEAPSSLRCPSTAPRELHSSSLDEPVLSAPCERQPNMLLRGSSFDTHESLMAMSTPSATAKMRSLNLDGSLLFSPRLKSHTSVFQSHDGGVASLSVVEGLPVTGAPTIRNLRSHTFG
jgi:hypothetical protein